MESSDRKMLEDRLTRQSYQTIEKELGPFSSADLLALLDSKSRKIGDTAATLLGRRKEMALLIDALLNDRVRTVLGRVRATNIINWRGSAVPEAIAAHLHLLDDRSDDVLSNALFAIVFMQRHDLLPKLHDYLAEAHPGSARHKLFREAIEALEAKNPSLFSPGFHDANNVWHLREPA